MATEKNITMKQFNGTDYDTLYPKTVAAQIDDVYSKDETYPKSQLYTQSQLYTKEQILTDSTKTLYGLGADAVPDDAFSLLSRFNEGLGNEYLWEKKEQYSTPALEGIMNNGCARSQQYSQSGYTTIQYSDSLNADGTLVNPQTITIDYATYTRANVLAGKFWVSSYKDGTFYSPVGSKASQYYGGAGNGYYYVMINQQKVIGFTTAYRFVEYVNSHDANAYPPAVSDGYTYTALGQLGNMAQIATGSYMGTGTYGNSNPNTLTFNFKPKYVLIYGTLTSGRNGITGYVFPCLFLTNVYTQYAYISNSITNEYSWAKVNENTLSWYSSVDNASNAQNQQANNNNYTYYYIAIG